MLLEHGSASSSSNVSCVHQADSAIFSVDLFLSMWATCWKGLLNSEGDSSSVTVSGDTLTDTPGGGSHQAVLAGGMA